MLDFLILVLIILGLGAVFYFLTRKMPDNTHHKVAVALSLGGALLLFWVSMGVGLFGEPDDTEALMVLIILAIGAVGGFLVGFRPGGMAWVMIAVAGAQLAFGIYSWLAGLQTGPHEFALNAAFVFLFTGTARLFRSAAQLDK